MSTAIIVMAAGGSRRMGQPKQLMCIGAVSLVRHAVQAALDSRATAITVVLGFQEDAIRAELNGLPIRSVSNPDWQAGMGSTIRAGVKSLEDQPECSSAILTVADSPGLTAETYNRIIAAHLASGLPIVASQYAGTAGVPVLFDRRYFDSLMNLDPHQGCKDLIIQNASTTMRLPCPEAAFDIDTLEDFQNFNNLMGN